MSSFSHQESSGGQTLTAASASQSSFGLEQFSPLVDTNLLDSPEWFRSPNEHHYHNHPAPTPTNEHLRPSFVPGFASHGIPVTVEALHRPSYPSAHPINGVPPQHDHGVPAQPPIDEFGAISTLQATYAPYTTPYPESTSSGQSEDPAVVDAEEDKRKRNQAASARFRQKKKQREQQMLEQRREMTERKKKLEGEVESLKRENTSLKRLLVENVDKMSDEDKALLAKMTRSGKEGLGGYCGMTLAQDIPVKPFSNG